MPLRRRPMATMARTAMIAGTATAVSGRVAHNQQMKYQQQAAAAPPQAAPAPAPEPAYAEPANDDVAQLQQLAQLHAQGILTDDEFTAKKAQILGI